MGPRGILGVFVANVAFKESERGRFPPREEQRGGAALVFVSFLFINNESEYAFEIFLRVRGCNTHEKNGFLTRISKI